VILNSLATLVKANAAPKTVPEMVHAKMVHAYVSKDSLARTAQSLNARMTATAMASVLKTRRVASAMMASSLRHVPTNIAQVPKVAKNAQETASAMARKACACVMTVSVVQTVQAKCAKKIAMAMELVLMAPAFVLEAMVEPSRLTVKI